MCVALNLTIRNAFHLQIGVADSGRIRKIDLVKLWKWEPENLPSVIHSIRTAIAATISLAVARLFGLPEGVLGRDCNARSHAIDTRRDSFNFGRTHCRYRFGCFGGGAPGKLFYWKSFGLRSYGICTRTFVRRISHGKKRLSLCQRHAGHHRAHPAFKRRLDHCTPPLLRSLDWNRRRLGAGGCVAGAPTRIREAKRRVNCQAAREPLVKQKNGLLL